MEDIASPQRLEISRLRSLLKHILYAIEYALKHKDTSSLPAFAKSIRSVLEEV